ncbi:UNVERIFIED_CONTAM: hypothetical protein Sradi_1520700 [Sesamum radiatum]|uniref:Uncharacterized protein n=1 Tax=Sesamum radiatum TaxID=300843 RepID=A0AAW2UA01_SESRA
MVFSKNLNGTTWDNLAQIFGVAVIKKHEKYLSLSMEVGRSKRDVFEGVKDWIQKKLRSWSSKQLSKAGRAVFLKTVIQTIPTYVMQCFRLPDSLLGEIESMMSIFFWNRGTTTKIYCLSWDKLCNCNEDGGLGFRQLKDCNLALLVKQAWRVVLMTDTLLHNIIGQKYFSSSNFFEAGLSSSPSSPSNHCWLHGKFW